MPIIPLITFSNAFDKRITMSPTIVQIIILLPLVICSGLPAAVIRRNPATTNVIGAITNATLSRKLRILSRISEKSAEPRGLQIATLPDPSY